MTDFKQSKVQQETGNNTKLKLNATAFVPSAPKSSSQSKAENKDQDASTFNINAPVFKPKAPKGQQKQEGQVVQQNASVQQNIKPIGIDPMNGYVNKFVSSNPAVQSQLLKRKQRNQQEEQKKKVYSLEYMFSIRQQYRDRPVNMALLDFPHKKRRNQFRMQQMSEIDKFNMTVKELRILLNKLSRKNYDTISKQILNDYSFTPSLLNELMKLIFMKATTESTYLEIYVKLCIQLFKKYNDKENKEMNFRKLLLTKCEKQFYKMHEKEEQERRSRRESMSVEGNEDDQKGNKQEQSSKTQQEQDFNKQMLFVFDAEEIKYRQKLQLYGNMKLIVELYTHRQIPEGIILTCINSLFEEMNDKNIELLCQMLFKISSHVVSLAETEKKQKEQGSGQKRRKPLSSCIFNLDYIEETLQKLFQYRKSDLLSSRIKFKIQDLIDEYNREWRHVIFGERKVVDSEGFQYKYVQKNSLSEEHVSPNPKTKVKKHSKAKEQYMYIKKSPDPKNEAKSAKSPMSKLLQNLKAEDVTGQPSSDDEDVRKIEDRKVSMNEQNILGMNFEKYNDYKPSQDIRRKIANYFLEYKETYDKKQAKEYFIEICQETSISHFVFIGYVLNNAYSQDQKGWDDIFNLIIDYLYLQEKLFTANDLLEGVKISIANFLDTLIDYPNSKCYAFQIFDKLNDLDILSKDEVVKYKQHIENLGNEEYEY